MQGTHLPGLPSRNLWEQRWCHQPHPQHASTPAALAPHTHHSPRAATASFRTSLFLSSKGLASARITRALYGSSCRTEGAPNEKAGCWLPRRRRSRTPFPLYMQKQAASCRRSTYHCCGQAGKCMGTAQGSDADSLEQTGMRAAQGQRKGAGWGQRRGHTHHSGAGGEAEELGDQCVNVQTHDLGSFKQQWLEAAQCGELHHTVRAGQGLKQERKQLRVGRT